jgi:multidrug efflux pump subunit AcrA (membrane-fusion protein)
VRFLDDEPEQAASAGPRIRLPSGAILRDGGNAYVWVVSDGRVERRAVTVGAESEGSVEVRAGVNSGDELVSPIVQGLEDGGKVKLKAS